MSNPADHSFYFNPSELCPYDIGDEGCHLESEEIGPCLCVNPVSAHGGDLDALHVKENEIARLTGALMRIAAIKNELDGDDWSEIEQARTIARLAISPRKSP